MYVNFLGIVMQHKRARDVSIERFSKKKLALTLYMLSESGKFEPPYYASEKEAEAALEKMKEGK